MGKRVVVKLGGSVLTRPEDFQRVAKIVKRSSSKATSCYS